MQTKCKCALLSRERLPNPPSPLPPHSKRNARLTLKWKKKKNQPKHKQPPPQPKNNPSRLKRSRDPKKRELSRYTGRVFSGPFGQVKSDGGAQSFCTAESARGKQSVPRASSQVFVVTAACRENASPPVNHQTRFLLIYLARNL